MSWQATNWASEQRVGRGNSDLKVLLLTLANYAGPNGESSWYSQAKISHDTEIPERTLRRCLQRLVEMELISIEPRKNPDGTKTTSMITVLMHPPAKLAAGENHRPDQGATTGQNRGSPAANKVAGQDSPKNNQEQSSIVRVEGKNGVRHIDTNFCELPLGDAPAKKPPKKRGTIPADYSITDEHRRFARELGFASAHAELLFDNFKDWHAARGSLMIDWMAAWRTWVRRDVQFNGAKRPPTSQQPGYGDDWG